MCCTFGDSTDSEWYAEHKLPYRKVILSNGKIADDVLRYLTAGAKLGTDTFFSPDELPTSKRFIA